MRVVILGCGYVGIELGRQLVPEHVAVGVRRSDEGLAAIRKARFDAIPADVTDDVALNAVPDADVLVFAASSGGRDAQAAHEVYVEGLRTAIDHFGARANPPDRLVYTSSTGVYGDHDGDWVDETTPIEPTTEKTQVLAEAERIARERTADHGITGLIARFAGLYGPDRYRLDRYLEGPVTAGYLNMIHRDDAAGALHALVTREDVPAATEDTDGRVVVVDDEPVEKHAFADWLAEECGVSPPEKQSKAERLRDGDLSTAARRRIETAKRCGNEKLHELGYELTYPTYRKGYRDAIAAYRA